MFAPTYKPSLLHGIISSDLNRLSLGHDDTLSAHFLASALRPSHPSHAIVPCPSGLCDKKKTIQREHFALAEPYLRNCVIDPTTYKTIPNKIYMECSKESIDNLGINRLLNAPPPPIWPSEKTHSRPEHTTMIKQLKAYARSRTKCALP